MTNKKQSKLSSKRADRPTSAGGISTKVRDGSGPSGLPRRGSIDAAKVEDTVKSVLLSTSVIEDYIGEKNLLDDTDTDDQSKSSIPITKLANLIKKDTSFIKSVSSLIVEIVLENEDFKQTLFNALSIECETKLKETKQQNAEMKKTLNTTYYQLDKLDQYVRRENLRIYGYPENEDSNTDDGEKIIQKIAAELKVKLNVNTDIQRAHRLGKKNPQRKSPRPVIVRFTSYKKRSEIIRKKKLLQKSESLKDCFMVEDLTTLRFKIFQYLKNEANDEFQSFHTINGKIKMQNRENEKWYTVESIDDLFRCNIEMDFSKLNYKPLNMNII